MAWFVYILENRRKSKSYAGKTNDPRRRLRQHNGEIAGGARYTRGDTWRIKYLFHNIPDNSTALRLEANLKSRYRSAELKQVTKDKDVIAAVRLQLAEVGATAANPADKRLRRALFALQKVRLTHKAKCKTEDLDIRLAVHPNLEAMDF